jgi:hypothetical protein
MATATVAVFTVVADATRETLRTWINRVRGVLAMPRRSRATANADRVRSPTFSEPTMTEFVIRGLKNDEFEGQHSLDRSSGSD